MTAFLFSILKLDYDCPKGFLKFQKKLLETMISHKFLPITTQDISLNKALTSVSTMLSILSTRNKTARDDYRLIYKTISALNIIFKKAREGQKIGSNYYKISHHTIYGTFERIVIYCISFLGRSFANRLISDLLLPLNL